MYSRLKYMACRELCKAFIHLKEWRTRLTSGHHHVFMDRSGMDERLWRDTCENAGVQALDLSPGFSDFGFSFHKARSVIK